MSSVQTLFYLLFAALNYAAASRLSKYLEHELTQSSHKLLICVPEKSSFPFYR